VLQAALAVMIVNIMAAKSFGAWNLLPRIFPMKEQQLCQSQERARGVFGNLLN
jgi:hypothetical protein